MRFDPDGPAVVLSPHFDDAVLSAWHVVSGPGEVAVVNVFAAVPDSRPPTPWDAAGGATDSRDHVLRRIEEDRAALALAGREPLALPFLDLQYRTTDPAPGELADALAALAPAASTLYAPAAIRFHGDHVLARDAAFELGAAAGVPLRLYADIPYAVHHGWPARVTGAPEDPHNRPDVEWEAALATLPVARESLAESVHRLDAAAAAAKLAAMRLYRTQFSLLNRGPIGMIEHPAVLPYEVSWTVAPGG